MQTGQRIFRHLPTPRNPRQGQLACGIRPNSRSVKNIQIDYFNMIYLMHGTGELIDDTGKRTKLYPGCVIFREPFKTHSIERTSEWLVFYANAGTCVWEMMRTLGMLSNDPVLYVGSSNEIRSMLFEYVTQFDSEKDSYLLVPRFIELVYRVRTLSAKINHSDSASDIWAEILEYCKVGMSVADIAAKLHINSETLRKQFRVRYGCSISKYRQLLRIELAKQGLLDGKSVKELANELGYCDEYALSHQFKTIVGISATQYKRKWG